MSLTLQLNSLLLYLAIAFAGGCVLTLITAAILYGQHVIQPQINVAIPSVALPDSLRVTVQQPPPPAAPMTRAELWESVYETTFGHPSEYADTTSQSRGAESARLAANAAVQQAFPNAT